MDGSMHEDGIRSGQSAQFWRVPCTSWSDDPTTRQEQECSAVWCGEPSVKSVVGGAHVCCKSLSVCNSRLGSCSEIVHNTAQLCEFGKREGWCETSRLTMPLLTRRPDKRRQISGANSASATGAGAGTGGGLRAYSARLRKAASLYIEPTEPGLMHRAKSDAPRADRERRRAQSRTRSQVPSQAQTRTGASRFEGSFARLTLRRRWNGNSSNSDQLTPRKASSVRDIRDFPTRDESAPKYASLDGFGVSVRGGSVGTGAGTENDEPKSTSSAVPADDTQTSSVRRLPSASSRRAVVGEQLVPVLRRLQAHTELCEHCTGGWARGLRAWMTTAGDFHVCHEGGHENVMRYDAFRARLGFCATFWVIARPGRVLDASSAVRWGLVGPSPPPLPRFIVQLFLASENNAGDDSEFTPGQYYASTELQGTPRWSRVSLHCVSLEMLKLILAWARRIRDPERAPDFPSPDNLSVIVALDIIDNFCVNRPDTILGPPVRR